MTYTRIQFKKVSLAFYLLSLLLVFYLYFNVRYEWFGISLIVRVYLYVFSFFMIYTYNMTGSTLVESLRPVYSGKYGKKGELLLQFESRILPFLSIFGIMIIYTFIDYLKEDDWPWNPLFLLLGGRYSNLVTYSLILHFILNIRRRPVVAVPVFMAISIFYFFADSMIYGNFPIGPGVTVYRIIKFSIFFFMLGFDFPDSVLAGVKTVVRAVVFACIFYLLILGAYVSVNSVFESKYYAYKKTSLALLKMGYSWPLADLQKKMVQKKDMSIISDIFTYGSYYNMIPDYSDETWQNMLFSQKSGRADEVASYMLLNDRTVPLKLLMGYVEERIAANDMGILDAKNFMRLTAQSVAGNEKIFFRKIDSSGKDFARWGLNVLRETGDIGNIPFLLKYLTNIDDSIAAKAYDALREITFTDPAATLKERINSPDVIEMFKKFYILTMPEANAQSSATGQILQWGFRAPHIFRP
jgi:hypothetical protein